MHPRNFFVSKYLVQPEPLRYCPWYIFLSPPLIFFAGGRPPPRPALVRIPSGAQADFIWGFQSQNVLTRCAQYPCVYARIPLRPRTHVKDPVVHVRTDSVSGLLWKHENNQPPEDRECGCPSQWRSLWIKNGHWLDLYRATHLSSVMEELGRSEEV